MQTQRAGDKPGKTEEDRGQEENHRALNIQANVVQSSGIASSMSIKWLSANNRGELQEFDSDLVEILQVAAKGELDTRLKFMTKIIVSMITERFGLMKSQHHKKTQNLNQRENKIRQLRREIKSLRKRFKKVSTEET